MTIREVQTGIEYLVFIEPIEDTDFKTLSVKKYSFSWEKEKEYNVFKLSIYGSAEILGLMSLNYIDSEQRVEIRLLASSIENVGSDKIFSGIAGCLIAYACRQSIAHYAEYACVSLIPKTRLRKYYVKEYGMVHAGNSVCLMGEGLIKMIQKHEL